MLAPFYFEPQSASKHLLLMRRCMFCHSCSLFGKHFKVWISWPVRGSQAFLRLSRYATALWVPSPSTAAFLFPT